VLHRVSAWAAAPLFAPSGPAGVGIRRHDGLAMAQR